MKKNIMTAAVINVVGYFNNSDQEELKKKMECLPTKMRWYLRKNLNAFSAVAKEFEDFRNDLVKELQEKWFSDEYSEEFVQTKTDEEGNPVLDEKGAEVTETMRKIKDEYMDDYEKAVAEVNKKLTEIAGEVNEVTISPIDVDAFVETLPDDSPIDIDFLDVMSIFQDNGEA